MDRIQKYITLYTIIGFLIPCGRYGPQGWGKILIRGPWMICRPARSSLGRRFCWLSSYIVNKILSMFDKMLVLTKTYTLSSSFQKCYGQNERTNWYIISCCLWKRLFTIIKTLQICICEGDPQLFDLLSNQFISPRFFLVECNAQEVNFVGS